MTKNRTKGSPELEAAFAVLLPRKINPVTFEQIMSFRPHIRTFGNMQLEEQPTIRDMAFDYYCKKYSDTDRANEATKQWTDDLYERFGRLTAEQGE